jgi:Ca2+-binding RTX toxin-like protein
MRPLASLLPAVAAALALLPGAADARVVVVAGTDGAAHLTDVLSNARVARLPLGAPGRAAAAAPDGSRGFAAAGRRVVAIDLETRAVAGAVAVPGVPAALAVAADGSRLYAARPGALDVIDPVALRLLGTIPLGRSRPTALAVSDDATRAALALDARHAGIVDLTAGRLIRRLRLARPSGVAFRRGSTEAWISSPSARGGRLVRFSADGRLLARWRLGRLVGGGGLAWTRNGRLAIVGGDRGQAVTAVFDLRRQRLHARIRTGRGPGRPAVSEDGTRVYVADGGDDTVSVLSALSFRRLAVQRLPAGARPAGLAVQPGLAVRLGTDAPELIRGTRGRDRVVGLGGDDRLGGGREADVLLGGPGADALTGGAADDVLDGGEGDDRLSGQSGNDQLLGGAGHDSANGGTGNDRLDGADGNDYLDGGDGDDSIVAGPGDDRIYEARLGNDFLLDGGPGDDYVRGGRGSDRRILGGEGNDTLLGGSGSEMVDGGDGDDVLDGGTGGDILFGRAGSDSIRGEAGRDTVYGSTGADAVDAGSGDDRLSGGDAADELVAGPGRDQVSGGRAGDVIRVADGDADVVDCGTGRDTVYVEEDAPARDRLRNCETVLRVPAEPATDAPPASNIFGTAGDDVRLGTPGDDSLFGAAGNDQLFGEDGNDYVDGEDGDDLLRGGNGDDEIHGRNGNDLILGAPGDDAITGDRGTDTINGEAGDDVINGNLDADVLAGGEGDDRIQAVGGGFDRIDCGPGQDTVFADVDDAVNASCEQVRR